MDPLTPKTSSKQITISSDETPKSLVLRLKSRESALKSQENNLKAQVEERVNTLSQSALGKSLINSNMKMQDLDKSTYYSLSDSEEELENEEVAYQCIDIQEQLDVVQEEQGIIRDNIEIVQVQEEEREGITNLQLLGRHLSNIVTDEGTTFLTALMTGGVALYVGGPVFGVGTALIAGNELLKMAYRYVQKGGASDHLQVVGKNLDNIEKRNALSEQSLKNAEKLQQEVSQKQGEIESALYVLTDQLDTTIGEQNAQIAKAITKVKHCQRALMQQSHDLQQVVNFLNESMNVSREQSKRFQSLLSAEYKIENEVDLKKVQEHINSAINAIKSDSDKSCTSQAIAMDYLLKAIGGKSDLIPLVHDLTAALTQIELLNQQLDEAKETVTKIQKSNEELKQANLETKKEVETLKKNTNEDKIELKVAKENFEKEKKKEHWGVASTTYGGALVGGTGATIGLALAGPVGALALGGIAFIKFGTCGIRAVHRARLVLRTNQLERKKLELEGLKKDLESSKFQKNGQVTVTAQYGESHGSYIGAKGAKGILNIVGSLANYAYGDELMSPLKSSHAGTVKCVIGTIPISFDFDKTTGPASAYLPTYLNFSGNEATDAHNEYLQYGAISQIDQINLCEVLLTELENGKVTPKMVLKLLKELSEVQIGSEVIAMIRKDSPLTEILRNRCQAIIKEGETITITKKSKK